MTEMDQHLLKMVNPEVPELEDMHPRPQQCKTGPQLTSCMGDTLMNTQGKDSCGPPPIQELDRESSECDDRSLSSFSDSDSDLTYFSSVSSMTSMLSYSQSSLTSMLSSSDLTSLTTVTSMSSSDLTSLISVTSVTLSSSDYSMRPDSCVSADTGSIGTAKEGMEASTAHSFDLRLQHQDSSVEMDSTVPPLQQTSMAAALGSPAHSEAGPCLKVLQALEQPGGSLHEQLHRYLELLGMTSSLQAQQATLHQEKPPSAQQQGWLQRLRDWLKRSKKWLKSLGKCSWRRRRNRGEQETCSVTQQKACGSEGSMGDGTRACYHWRLQQLHQVLQNMDSEVQERRAWVLREMEAITRVAPVN
ncbi:uncharacterized protein LOC134439844 [Engraulis encrasicolus]|uniref:uncharacterized protein LOC134439844 n=1 Tax=Engraulis encrasicolus TaxID=184585 RepID=UPI002FCF2E28